MRYVKVALNNENKEDQKGKIKIVKDGPYIVSGGVPLAEKIIVAKGKKYEYQLGRELPQAETYALCRCGKSKNTPFCDGTHMESHFQGEETASKEKYLDRTEFFKGPGVDLLDDDRCAFARFCHRDSGNAWELTELSDNEEYIAEAIRAACDCPAGRLTAVDKDGTIIEAELVPEIDIIQDPERGASAGIFVKGYIPIESADGSVYEVRNRAALCRCGKSRNMPFCDATHITVRFNDK